MKRLTFILGIALVSFVWLASAVPVEADLMLKISDGLTTLLIEDEDFVPVAPNTDPDEFPGPGVVQFTGSFGSFSVVVSVGTSKPLIGPGMLDLFSVNVSGGHGTLLVELTDTDYFFPESHPSLLLEVSGTTNGTVSIESFFDLSNTEFGTAETGPSVGPFVTGPFSATSSGLITSTGTPYSLTLAGLVTHLGPGQVSSFDAQLSVVPVPAAVILGVLGLGIAGVKLRKYA